MILKNLPPGFFPPLKKDRDLAFLSKDKIELLKLHHFLLLPQADFSNMVDFEYLNPILILAKFTYEKISQIIQKSKKNNTLNPNKILNRILQLFIYN